jgi:uncharacterized protein
VACPPGRLWSLSERSKQGATSATQDRDLVPTPTPDSAFYWEGLRRGQLLLQQCLSCKRMRFPPMSACPYCGSPQSRVRESSGQGSIYSWVRTHRAFRRAFTDRVPYVIAIIELDEGPRIYGELRSMGSREVRAGGRVQAAFDARTGYAVLYFVPDTEGD